MAAAGASPSRPRPVRAALACCCAAALAPAAGAADGPTVPRPLPRSAKTPVLQEPTASEHYGWLRDYKEVPFEKFDAAKGPPIPRFTNLDDATFQQMIRDGAPFVVDDCTKGFDADAISNFECKDFADRWPSGNMRAEYTPGQYHIYLKDKDWYSQIHPQRSHEEHMAGDSKIAGPYIWHVKDEEPLKTKRSVQKHWRTPYFLDRSVANRVEANESFEFWFSMAGGGTFAHADAYCESTISMQFKGHKRWRLQAFPRGKHYLNASSFGDEQIYDKKEHTPWAPETEFVVAPGQCFIFPTGYIHETFVEPVPGEQACYTASTFQFNHPRQVNLYRAYMGSFGMSHYGMGEPCLDTMSGYATLFSSYRGPPDEAALRQEATMLIAQIEGGGGDGQLSRDELYAHFCTDKKARKRLMKKAGFHYNWHRLLSAKDRDIHEEEAMQTWAEDALQYHDIDHDRAISLDELTSSLLQWHVVRVRKARTAAAGGKKKASARWVNDVLASESEVLRQHHCGGVEPCPVADELEAYGEELKKNKRACAHKARKVGGMFEGEEGDDATLTLHDRSSGTSSQQTVRDLKHGEL